METIKAPPIEFLQEVLADLKEPMLFKNMLVDVESKEYVWRIFDWSLVELANLFDDKELPFRTGYNAATLDPQWEINCPVKLMTLKKFLDETNSGTDNKVWYYFDYKHMEEWFKDKPDILESIDWNLFGINKSGHDSTLWIGNKGSHTNCHQDSYGCNLIAQIHGRKQWLLLPPSSTNTLCPTRIPYEESTIYSKFNFFSPMEESIDIIKKIPEKAKLVTLEPGDVLFVPRGWWHYVESLDVTVSVNVWLPLETDDRARLEEALVKLLVTSLGENISSVENEPSSSLSYCLQLVNATLQKCKSRKDSTCFIKRREHLVCTLEDLIRNYPNHVQSIKALEGIELQQFLMEKGNRFPDDTDLQKPNLSQVETLSFSCETVSATVLNTFCHPDVLNKVTELLLNTNIE